MEDGGLAPYLHKVHNAVRDHVFSTLQQTHTIFVSAQELGMNTGPTRRRATP